jgi:hypothetical protein
VTEGNATEDNATKDNATEDSAHANIAEQALPYSDRDIARSPPPAPFLRRYLPQDKHFSRR